MCAPTFENQNGAPLDSCFPRSVASSSTRGSIDGPHDCVSLSPGVISAPPRRSRSSGSRLFFLASCPAAFALDCPVEERERITPGTTQTGPRQSAAATWDLLARTSAAWMHLDPSSPREARACYQRGFTVPCVHRESVADATAVLPAFCCLASSEPLDCDTAPVCEARVSKPPCLPRRRPWTPRGEPTLPVRYRQKQRWLRYGSASGRRWTLRLDRAQPLLVMHREASHHDRPQGVRRTARALHGVHRCRHRGRSLLSVSCPQEGLSQEAQGRLCHCT